MGAKRYSTEQIILKLREAEIEMGRGVKVPEVCRKLGISEQTFYRWRKLGVSERRACRALGQPRSTQRYRGSPRADKAELVDRMTELALQYGRYGYRKSARFLQREGYAASPKRIERLWRREGLKVPKRRRLWLNDGSCMR